MRAINLVLVGALVTAAATAQAAGPKQQRLVVLETRATGALDPKTIDGLSALIASEAGRHPIKVVAGSDLTTLLGFERKKQILGCSDTGCLAEIGGALGAQYLLSSEVSEIGGVLLLTLTLLDTNRSQALGRLTRKAEKMRSLVDLAGPAVHELLNPVAPPAAPLADVLASTGTAGETSDSRVLGYVLDGVGVVAIGAGVFLGLSAQASYDDARRLADARARGEAVSQDDFEQLRESTGRSALAADVLYGLGAVALGTGLYFTFSGGGSQAATLSFSPAPGGGAAFIAGEF